MQDLNEHLLEVYERDEAFRVTNDDQASWAMRKIARARMELADAEAQAHLEKARIDSWLQTKRTAVEDEETFFTALLAKYYLPQHTVDPKKKTFKLPVGTFKIRQQQPDFQRDDAALLGFLEDRIMYDFIETVKRPKWGELKKAIIPVGYSAVLKETGETIPGITVQERGIKFSVETDVRKRI